MHRLLETATFLRSHGEKHQLPSHIDAVLILGSGLGEFGDVLSRRAVDGNVLTLNYSEIPHFPHLPTGGVEGHAGKLLVAQWAPGFTLACMQGRFHYYEGYELPEVIYPIRALQQWGAKTLIVTNAAGGIGDTLNPGDLMMITDHINFTGQNPLRGKNEPSLGPRFQDMSEGYSLNLQKLALTAAQQNGITLKQGVYAWVTGPSYETPAEVRMLKTLGADAVGMSTVPEVIAANHMSMAVLGVSCITNKAAGLSAERLSHQEVVETGHEAAQRFSTLIGAILDQLAQTTAMTPA